MNILAILKFILDLNNFIMYLINFRLNISNMVLD